MYFLELLKTVQVQLPLLCLKLPGSQKEKSTLRENAVPGNLLFLSSPFSHNCGVIATKKETEKGKEGAVGCASTAVQTGWKATFSHTPGFKRAYVGDCYTEESA